jgi:hypothetical protein
LNPGKTIVCRKKEEENADEFLQRVDKRKQEAEQYKLQKSGIDFLFLVSIILTRILAMCQLFEIQNRALRRLEREVLG